MGTWKFASAAIAISSLLVHGAACVADVLQSAGAAAAIPHEFYSLIHADAVHEELKLTTTQRANLRRVTDRLDEVYFRVRSQPGEQGQQALLALVGEAQRGVAEILNPAQQARLNQLACRVQGNSAMVRDDVVRQLRLTSSQVEKVRGILTETKNSLTEIQKKSASDDPGNLKDETERLRQEETKQLAAALSPEQQRGWMQLVGDPFDFSRVTPGPFKAPELQPAAAWINSDGEKLSELRGRVVVVHFYCFGCINCIHNFPSYRKWLTHFQGRDVTIIGIHSPETQRERDVAAIRERAAAEKLNFPILVDTEMKNWNAWGNTMWPTVYVIDKRGYLRNWWQGELNWQGATGEQQMLQKIEALLME